MPPPKVRISLEATVARLRSVVYLNLNGYRFELEAPSPARAMDIVVELGLALGLDEEDGGNG